MIVIKLDKYYHDSAVHGFTTQQSNSEYLDVLTVMQLITANLHEMYNLYSSDTKFLYDTVIFNTLETNL